MAKACVFCGRASGKTTKEHVIPRWLMRLANNQDSQLRIWLPLKTGSNITSEVLEINQSRMQFPACLACNQHYAQLEARAKLVVEKILQERSFSAEELSLFLDWLDKVRVGLWLGMRLLENDPFQMPVNFHIADRIGAKDRAVFIYKIEEDRKGWGCFGISTPNFHKHPSCFTLFVNSFYFLSVSTDFLLSKRMGFAYPLRARTLSGGKVQFDIVEGNHRFGPPFVEFKFAPGCGQIYQPILAEHLTMSLPPKDLDYLDRFRPTGSGHSRPLFVLSGGNVSEVKEVPTSEWRPTRAYRASDDKPVFLKQTLRIQNEIAAAYMTNDPAARNDIESGCSFNEACIREIDRRFG